MFDNLRSTLGRFREDAEETAEEKAEAVDGEESGESAAEALEEEGPVAGLDDDESAVGATVDGAETTDGPESAPESDQAGAEAEAENDTGLRRKARSLVRGKFVIDEGDLEGPLQQLELELLGNDVEMGVAEELVGRIEDELVGETRTFRESTGSVIAGALQEAIVEIIDVGQFDLVERIEETESPVVIVFTGVNGVGKTTSIAKLARYLESHGLSTVLANGDTYRAGANEQIHEHAERLDKKLIAHEQGGDPAAVIYDAVEYARANDVDVVLGDTAGRLHTDEDLMAQLEKIDRVVDPDLTLFVDEAVAGQDAVNRAREFNEAAAVDGAILTKADADANGGAAISIAHVTGKPILFLGVGQEYEDLERFEPETLASSLVDEE